jgi:hypothetical protein
VIALVAYVLAVAVVLLALDIRGLRRERDAAIKLRDDANDAMRRMAEERVFARVRSSVVSWVQRGSREAN